MIATLMSKGNFAMSAKIIIMIFQLANLVIVIRKEAKIRLVTLIAEIVIVIDML